jgi:transcriptional regulator with XRE-family HTH domain
MNFSERLKELREKKGLSQEALADKLNIPRSSVTNYENDDKRMPRQQRLNEIADFFGVSVDYLIGRSNTAELSNIEKNFLSDMEELTIEELFKKYKIKIDGKTATKEELEGAAAFIRSLRSMK